MTELLIISLSIFAFAMISERLSMSMVTAPMVFTGIGILVGPAGLGWINLETDAASVSLLVEATLVLLLFTDAIRIDLRKLNLDRWLPIRLLGVGLPLTLVFGTVVGMILLTDLSLLEAALLAAVLAPTDAALGQAVVSDRRLPVRLRQGLNVESGLNDGILVPVVTVLLGLAAAQAGELSFGGFATRQILGGLAAGLIAGGGGGWLIHHRASAGHIEGLYRQLATFGVAAAAFSAASLVGGNGFIAAFVAGLAFGTVAKEECAGVQDFTEDEGELLAILTFTVFGAVFVGPLLSQLTWEVVVYSVLSLTVVRMLPVLIALWRTGTLIETRLFAGWFGPRGLASILFALVVLESMDTAGTSLIFTVSMFTVLLSVFAHGMTASPWSAHLAQSILAGPDDMPEMMDAAELPTRRTKR